ncbi:MAG: alpha/beta hydrolase [Pseudomonadota bacterium]
MAVKTLILLALLAGAGVLGVRAIAAANERAAEAAYPPEGQFVMADGVRMHAVVRGDGPDVVLIHGAGGSSRDFTFALMDQLAPTYRVIAIDRPGQGWSGRKPGYSIWSRDAESPQDQARLLQATAAALGADAPIVVGHSFGGAVAMAWALERPENLSGIVMLAGVSNEWEGGVGQFYNITASPIGGALLNALAVAFVPQSYIDASVAGTFAPQDPPAGYADHFGPRMTARREPLRANGRQVHGLKPHIIDMVPGYGAIDVPLEIIHGDADTIVPLTVHSVPLSTQVPGANLTVLEGVGHMPHHVDPDATLAAIDRAATRAGLR